MDSALDQQRPAVGLMLWDATGMGARGGQPVRTTVDVYRCCRTIQAGYAAYRSLSGTRVSCLGVKRFGRAPQSLVIDQPATRPGTTLLRYGRPVTRWVTAAAV